MNPEIWGPGAWTFLHTITLNYPNNPDIDVIDYHKNFFVLLKNIIPCEKCRLHYSQYLIDNPIDDVLNNKQDFVIWLNKLHNEINVRNNKPEMNIKNMIKLYRKKYSEKNNNKMYMLILLFIIIFLFFWLFIK
jgi:FAD-linked sulfhydryl oxidase